MPIITPAARAAWSFPADATLSLLDLQELDRQCGYSWTVETRYAGPTNSRGSRWLATIKRDASTVWRGSATFEEGPITAALRAATKAGVEWQALTCHSLDADTYVVGF